MVIITTEKTLLTERFKNEQLNNFKQLKKGLPLGDIILLTRKYALLRENKEFENVVHNSQIYARESLLTTFMLTK